MEPRTLVHLLAHWADTRGDRPALWERGGDGRWTSTSWRGYWTAVREAAKGLIAIGHQVGDCVAIVGRNRSDWVICELAIMAARGVPAPIYTTNTDEQRAYIVSHSRSRIAIADDAEALEAYRRCVAAGLMSVETLVTMDEVESSSGDTLSLAALRALGREQDDAELDRRLAELTDSETCLLIYTSGTTGVPKAVMLDHGNMVSMTGGIIERFPVFGGHVEYICLSYLPLCHIAEQLFTNVAGLYLGGQAYFCPDIALLKDYLPEVRPTSFLGVPRVWEKFQAALEARFAEATGAKGALVSWARHTELRGSRLGSPEAPSAIVGLQDRLIDGLAALATRLPSGLGGVARTASELPRRAANKLVISKIIAALGLDRLALAATGAAPISVSTLEFFASIGIVICEGFGMSETAGLATSVEPGKPAFGTVGQPFPGVSLRIADDGEILLKGRMMTRGYLHDPERTAELIDGDGWLHTGDLGQLDTDGNLVITGRKKDLIITAGGKNVAPVEIESHINRIPGVGQSVVVGDRKPYLCALITLAPELVAELRNHTGSAAETVEQMAGDARVRRWLDDQIENHVNDKLARYQTIKRFVVLPAPFSIESGELTPTLKLKRNVITERYADQIEALYGDRVATAAR